MAVWRGMGRRWSARAAIMVALATAAACAPNVGPAGPVRPGSRCTALGAGAPVAAEQTTVLNGGDGRYPVYRIPAVVTTGSGVVLTFAEGRPSLADPGSGRIDVVMRRSLDCGRSWGEVTVLADNGAGDAHNPTAVVAPGAGGVETVFLFYSERPASAGGEFDLPAGSGPGTETMWLRTSTDAGATWSEPRSLTASVKDPSWRVASFGPGQGIVTRWPSGAVAPGRIVVPGWYSSDSPTTGSFVAYSDDGGDTWSRRPMPVGGTDEAQLVQLTDGSLQLDARSDTVRQLFRSDDGGDTWRGPTVGLPMTPVMSGVLRDRAVRDGDDTDRLLHSGVATDGRFDVRVWASRDESVSWFAPTILARGVDQYSLLTPLDDGTVGLVYEALCVCDDGTGARLGLAVRFLRFDPDRVDPGS